VGEAEVKFIILFSDLTNKNVDLVIQKGLIEPIALIILLMIAEIFSIYERMNKPEPKKLLSTLILTFANNYKIYSAGRHSVQHKSGNQIIY